MSLQHRISDEGGVKVCVLYGVVNQETKATTSLARAVPANEMVVREVWGAGAVCEFSFLYGCNLDLVLCKENQKFGGSVFDAVTVELQDVETVDLRRRGSCW